MSDLLTRLVEVARANEASAGPCPHPVGSRARVLRKVIEDGVTPHAFAGGVGTVESAHIAPGRNYWRMVVRLPCGLAARFDEMEMDRRFGPRATRDRWAKRRAAGSAT